MPPCLNQTNCSDVKLTPVRCLASKHSRQNLHRYLCHGWHHRWHNEATVEGRRKLCGQLIGCIGKQTVPSLGAEPLGRSKLLLPIAAASKHPTCYGLPRFEVTSSTPLAQFLLPNKGSFMQVSKGAKRTVENPFYSMIWMVPLGFGKIACTQSSIARITSVSKVGLCWLIHANSDHGWWL